MKKILLVLLVLIVNVSFAQTSEGDITTYINTNIRLKPTLPSRTADAFDVLNISKVSLLGSYSNPSFLNSLAWSKITSVPTDLTSIIGLTASNDDFLQRKSGVWTNRSIAQVKSDLGLNIAANNFVFGTGSSVGKIGTDNFYANSNALVWMTQTPPTIHDALNFVNNVWVFGEDITIFGNPGSGTNGTVTDTFITGTSNVVGDNVNFFSGSAGFVWGNRNKYYGYVGMVGGQYAELKHSGEVSGGLFSGGGMAIGLSIPSSDSSKHVTAFANAINISANTSAQVSGRGALGALSGIFGGYDHHIPSTSPNSLILGGHGIVARSSDPDQVYVPNFNIASTPVNDDALTQVLVRNSSTGQIKYRTASSFSGSAGGSDTQVQYNSSGAFAGSSSFTWDNANTRLSTAKQNIGNPISESLSGKSFVALGNSLTAGTGASTTNWRFSKQVSNLYGLTEASTGTGGITAQTFAVSNLGSIPTYNSSTHKYLCFELGINDLTAGRTSVQYSNDMTTILNNAITTKGWPASQVIVLSIAGSYIGNSPTAYNSALVTLCGSLGAIYVDITTPFSSQGISPTIYTADNIHPNDQGHLLIAEVIYSTVKQLNTISSQALVTNGASQFNNIKYFSPPFLPKAYQLGVDSLGNVGVVNNTRPNTRLDGKTFVNGSLVGQGAIVPTTNYDKTQDWLLKSGSKIVSAFSATVMNTFTLSNTSAQQQHRNYFGNSSTYSPGFNAVGSHQWFVSGGTTGNQVEVMEIHQEGTLEYLLNKGISSAVTTSNFGYFTPYTSSGFMTFAQSFSTGGFKFFGNNGVSGNTTKDLFWVGNSGITNFVSHTFAAGTTAAGTAPMKIPSGPLMTSPEIGAIEFLTDKTYFTITTGAARKEYTLNDAALTSGFIPIATTNGRLTNWTDPNVNSIIGWDDTDGVNVNVNIGSGLTYTHSTHTLSSSGGGITNTAANNELMKSDGTNAVPSGIFSTLAGNASFGTGISGANRSLIADGSATDVGFIMATKGIGNYTFGNSTSTGSNRIFAMDGSVSDVGLIINTKGTGHFTVEQSSSVGLDWNGSKWAISNGVGYTPTRLIHALEFNASNSSITRILTLDHSTSGTPAIGVGVGMEFISQNSSGSSKIGAAIDVVTTDVTPASEDFDIIFNTMAAGATASERIRISSTGTKLSTVLNLKSFTVSTLPTGTVGDVAYVTDALTPSFLVAVVGGGSTKVPVFFDGTNWVTF